jgi:hypothetical protein
MRRFSSFWLGPLFLVKLEETSNFKMWLPYIALSSAIARSSRSEYQASPSGQDARRDIHYDIDFPLVSPSLGRFTQENHTQQNDNVEMNHNTVLALNRKSSWASTDLLDADNDQMRVPRLLCIHRRARDGCDRLDTTAS